MLFIVSTFNYVDRTIISILQVPIKTELRLSDAQMGALTGLSFALFYTTFSLPIARLADRANRRNIVALSLFVWSGMTAMGGLALNYAMLVLFRIGVAVGEAGSIPATQSIIADLFPRDRRATALAVWGLSLPVGLMAGYGVTGKLAQMFDWRIVFAMVGGAGVLFSPLVFLFTREPQRGRFDPPAQAEDHDQSTLFGTLREMAGMRVLRFLMIAAALHGFTQYSLMNWTVPFYVRLHDMSLVNVGFYMAASSGLGGAIGMFFGGYLADRLGQRDERWRVWIIGLSFLATVMTALGQLLAQSLNVSLAFGFLVAVFQIAYYGPIVAVVQTLVSARQRAFVGALLLLVFNIVGLGLGPFLTGALSDYLAGVLGDESLRWSLVACLGASAVAGLAFLWIGRAFRTEIHRVRELSPA
ncbi:MAG: spinster family MFS transporter [Novosphingobium sp.]